MHQDHTGGAYSILPDHLAVFKIPTSKEREGKGKGRERRKWGGEGRKGKGGESDLMHPLSQIPGYAIDIYTFTAQSTATPMFNNPI